MKKDINLTESFSIVMFHVVNHAGNHVDHLALKD